MDLDNRFEKRTFHKFGPNCIITTVKDILVLHLRNKAHLFFLFFSKYIYLEQKKVMKLTKVARI